MEVSATEPDSRILTPLYTPSQTGIHWLSASADGGGTGAYTIKAVEVTSQEQRSPNSPPTGDPGISGTPQVGETLTASTTGIADDDGLANAVFAYQWIRHDLDTATDEDIQRAEGEGKALKVRGHLHRRRGQRGVADQLRSDRGPAPDHP